MTTSTSKSPPTRRVVQILACLFSACRLHPGVGPRPTLLAICGITTSTCALILAELETANWVTRRADRRYGLGNGLLGVVHGLRRQFPLLDRGRDALTALHATSQRGVLDVANRRRTD